MLPFSRNRKRMKIKYLILCFLPLFFLINSRNVFAESFWKRMTEIRAKSYLHPDLRGITPSQELAYSEYDVVPTFDRKIDKIGQEFVYYNTIHPEKIAWVGSKKVEYNLKGQIHKIGNERVTYSVDNRILRIGNKRVIYNGARIIKIGNDEVFYK